MALKTTICVVLLTLCLVSSQDFNFTSEINPTPVLLQDRTVEGEGPRISGGSPAGDAEFPYQVAILKKNSLSGIVCSGAILKENYVITSARCVQQYSNANELEVIAGNNRITHDPPSVVIGVNQIHINPEYNSNTHLHDLAILKLDESFNITDKYIRSAEIRKESLQALDECTVSGWGTGNNNDDRLQKLTVTILSADVCKSQINLSDFKGHVCANAREGEVCFKDEGNPLTCGHKIAGILSDHYNCGAQNKPGNYVELSAHLEWIERTLRGGAAVQTSSLILVAAVLVLSTVRSLL